MPGLAAAAASAGSLLAELPACGSRQVRDRALPPRRLLRLPDVLLRRPYLACRRHGVLPWSVTDGVPARAEAMPQSTHIRTWGPFGRARKTNFPRWLQ